MCLKILQNAINFKLLTIDDKIYDINYDLLNLKKLSICKIGFNNKELFEIKVNAYSRTNQYIVIVTILIDIVKILSRLLISKMIL